jgi:hypothetical protein
MGCERLPITDIYLGGLGIGVSAFEDCAMLQNIHLHGNSANVFCLRRNTFRGCTSLKAVILPQQVRIIEESAFQNCSKSCFINYEGDDFWFLGADALGNCQCVRWGLICNYEKQEAPLSDLLKTFSIDRDSFLRTLDTICKSRGYYYDYLGAYGDRWAKEDASLAMDIIRGKCSFPERLKLTSSSMGDDYCEPYDGPVFMDELGQRHPSEGY